MTLADLKAQLDDALKVEDYSLAARLRDAIQWVWQRGCMACYVGLRLHGRRCRFVFCRVLEPACTGWQRGITVRSGSCYIVLKQQEQ